MKIYFAIKYYADLSNKDLIARICGIAEEKHQMTCAHRDLEKWGEVSFTENELMKQVLEIIDGSDAVVAELSETGVGLGIEMGYAKAKGISVYIMYDKGTLLLSSAAKGTCDACFEYGSDEDIRRVFDFIGKHDNKLPMN